MKKLVYADNAATTKLDMDAFEAMKPFMLEEYGNASQPYSFSRSSRNALKKARNSIAECIGADSDEIYFTSGGTESDNWAIKRGVKIIGNRKSFITSKIEHHAVLNAAMSLKKDKYESSFLDVTKEGVVLPSFLEDGYNDVALVSIMYANNEVGTIQPIKELAKKVHGMGALFHTDAVQAVGHIPINVHELGVDMLSASSHKFNGPKGVGFLYVKKGVEISPLMDGGAQENLKRAGTENIAGIVGMATALKKNCSEIEMFQSKMTVLEECLMSGLQKSDLDFIRNGSDEHLPGNISLSFRNSDGEMILHRMDLMGICISTGSACDSKNTQISHVIKAIQVPEEYAKGTIRISFGKDNIMEDADRIVEALVKILK